jgi:hypothetical protein
LFDVKRRRREIGCLGDAHAVERTDRCAGEYVNPASGSFEVAEQLDQGASLKSAPRATTGEDNCNFTHVAASVSVWIGKDENEKIRNPGDCFNEAHPMLHFRTANDITRP